MKSMRKTRHKYYTRKYYFGEYLSQGRTELFWASDMVSFKDLVDAGLLTLQPGFNPKINAWATEAIRLREIFDAVKSGKSSPCQISDEEWVVARRIGDLFRRWELLMVAYFLALRPRVRMDSKLLHKGPSDCFKRNIFLTLLLRS